MDGMLLVCGLPPGTFCLYGFAESRAKKGTREMVRSKKVRRQRKAPGAPKRGKSPYILFSMNVRDEIKKTLPEGAKVRISSFYRS